MLLNALIIIIDKKFYNLPHVPFKIELSYNGLFLRGVYFANFEIAAIRGINFCGKPHPRT